MMTRRSFLTAAAALAGSPTLIAQRGNRGSSQVSTTLPSSIAALTSMRDQAKPITSDERRARIEKARRLMAAEKIDALILSGGTSLVYFTNIRWGGGERLFARRTAAIRALPGSDTVGHGDDRDPDRLGHSLSFGLQSDGAAGGYYSRHDGPRRPRAVAHEGRIVIPAGRPLARRGR